MELNVELSRKLAKAVRARRRECYLNSLKALSDIVGARYVEGYAAIVSMGIPLEHGWLQTADDQVVDVTWFMDAPIVYEPLFVFETNEWLRLVAENNRVLPVGWLLRPTPEQVIDCIIRCGEKVKVHNEAIG